MTSSDLEYLLLKYPNKPWNWKRLSQNPAISFEFIKTHLDKPWHYNYFCRHPQVPLGFIEKHYPYLRREWFRKRPNVDMAFIQRYSDDIPNMDWWTISGSRLISMDDIVTHSDLPWSPHSTLRNPNITLTVAETLQVSEHYFWEELSHGIDMQTVRLNSDKPWLWTGLCHYNPHMTFAMYLEYAEKFESGMESAFATVEDIKAHPEIDWKTQYWYAKNAHISDDWLYESGLWKTNSSVVRTLSGKAPMEILEKEPDRWGYEYIAKNPNLTATFVEQHLERFDDFWYILSENTFDGPKRLPFVSESRRAMLNELLSWADSPPIATDRRTIYQRGGSRYHENWLDVNDICERSHF